MFSGEKKKKKRVMKRRNKPSSEGQLGKVIVDEIEQQSNEEHIQEIKGSFQQLKVIDETEALASEKTPRKKTGSLDFEIVDETEVEVLEETPQKIEKIPNASYWDRQWTQGWSQYHLPELEDNIEKIRKKFHENDLSNLREQLMNSSYESPAKWKKKSRKDLNKKEIIGKHLNWELKRRILEYQCQFLGLKYQEPKPFPKYCESETGKKMTFFMDYYWPSVNRYLVSWNDLSESEYIKVWKEWVYNDEDRIEDLEKKIKQEIKKRIHLIITCKWKLIPPEEQELIRKKEIEFRQEIERKTKQDEWVQQQRIAARIVQSDQSGFVCGGTGSIGYGPNENCKTHGEAMREWKQFMRDS